jgi:predicted ATPase
VLYGLRTYYHIRGELRAARKLAEELLRLAEWERASDPLLTAHSALGSTLFFVGELVAARAELEQGISLYSPRQYRSHIYLYTMDSGVILLGFVTWTLWFLGYPDQAQKRNQEVLKLGEEVAHPYSLAWALIYACWFHQHRREGEATQARAEAAITLATDQGFGQILAWATIACGWALAEQGKREEGIQQMRQGLVALRAMGAEAVQSWVLALMAEAHGKMGQAEEGLALLAEALAVVDRNGEHFYEAELHRLQGELTLQSGKQGLDCRTKEAEACFLKAFEVARKQQAKSLELRATMSLARLLTHQGHRDEARSMLANIYGWFTEGFNTADLKEAKALLDELDA